MGIGITISIRGEISADDLEELESRAADLPLEDAEDVEFEAVDGGLRAYVTVGTKHTKRNTNVLERFATKIRADFPQLAISMKDDWGEEWLEEAKVSRPSSGGSTSSPDAPIELIWKPEVLDIWVGPLEPGRKAPSVSVAFHDNRPDVVAPPLWSREGRWFYQVWLLGTRTGTRSGTVRLIDVSR